MLNRVYILFFVLMFSCKNKEHKNKDISFSQSLRKEAIVVIIKNKWIKAYKNII